MDGIRPPGAISLKETMLPMHLKNYQQFECYMYAIKADNEPDMRKISVLLTVVRPEAQDVYRTFTYGTEESPKTCADVINKFIDYCIDLEDLYFFKETTENIIIHSHKYTHTKTFTCTC